jgi:hypothetical protein
MFLSNFLSNSATVSFLFFLYVWRFIADGFTGNMGTDVSTGAVSLHVYSIANTHAIICQISCNVWTDIHVRSNTICGHTFSLG